MVLPYTINTNSTCEFRVFIDDPSVLAVPHSVKASLGDKEKFFVKYLKDSLGENEKLTAFLVHLNYNARIYGEVYFICNCRTKNKFHIEGLKKFLTEHQEELELLESFFILPNIESNILNSQIAPKVIQDDMLYEPLKPNILSNDVDLEEECFVLTNTDIKEGHW